MDRQYTIQDLLYLMRRLRDRGNGCPWDIEQTFATIAPHTLEEAYEVIDCIEREDFTHLREELGDLLFQVVYHSQMASEEELFDFSAVVDALVAKLLSRHPHVFPNGELTSSYSSGSTDALAVRENWEERKASERASKKVADPSELADVPVGLPSLVRAQKLQKRAGRAGFDWPDVGGVLDKLEEEINELREAMAEGDEDAIADEVGDLMFTCVNLARHLGVDAETASRFAASKFESRFRAMEKLVASDGAGIGQLDAEQLERYWQRAKREGAGRVSPARGDRDI